MSGAPCTCGLAYQELDLGLTGRRDDASTTSRFGGTHDHPLPATTRNRGNQEITPPTPEVRSAISAKGQLSPTAEKYLETKLPKTELRNPALKGS
jgi:hypothetical protein